MIHTMPLLGYGEDALTLHTVTAGLANLFRQLGDPSDPSDSIRFFRPGFGRRSSRPGAGLPCTDFGEFDAIIGSSTAVYLIEAKWTNSGEQVPAESNLRPEELRRHLAFRTYLEQWRFAPSATWEVFAKRIAPALGEMTEGLVPPRGGSTLARNLEFVLRQLADCGSSIVDVLLLSRVSSSQMAPTSCGEFRIVTQVVEPAEASGFIRLVD